MTEPFVVSDAEAGQKLLQFLRRRCAAPDSMLHKWIRSGQVRINGSRTKAFDRLDAGDLVRIPPFALNFTQKTEKIASQEQDTLQNVPLEKSLPSQNLPLQNTQMQNVSLQKPKNLSLQQHSLPPIITENEDFILFNKPAGLPVHSGSGHEDSLATRLASAYADAPFRPTPVHRLDKDTSGLLLVAKNYRTLRKMSDLFATHAVVKEYLAWVSGKCPWQKPTLLEDYLYKGIDRQATQEENVHNFDKRERVHVAQFPDQDTRYASLVVRCLLQTQNASLAHIRLNTGRTHQIRVQMSAHGFPLIGDRKYGGPQGNLMLHACRLIVDGKEWTVLPDWQEKWQVKDLRSFLCR